MVYLTEDDDYEYQFLMGIRNEVYMKMDGVESEFLDADLDGDLIDLIWFPAKLPIMLVTDEPMIGTLAKGIQ